MHYNNASGNRGYGYGTGSGSGGGAADIFPDEEPGFMNAAKGWMQAAGSKLAEVEKEVWKRINDAHDEK
jgi:hypothetical protein